MEQVSNINEPANNSKPTNRLTALAFFEIGIFEVVFVIVGVLLLLGTINYFKNSILKSPTVRSRDGVIPASFEGAV